MPCWYRYKMWWGPHSNQDCLLIAFHWLVKQADASRILAPLHPGESKSWWSQQPDSTLADLKQRCWLWAFSFSPSPEKVMQHPSSHSTKPKTRAHLVENSQLWQEAKLDRLASVTTIMCALSGCQYASFVWTREAVMEKAFLWTLKQTRSCVSI